MANYLHLMLSLLAFIIDYTNILNPISASRVGEKIYTPLQSNHYCSRRLNATHQMGCASELGGNLGIVWMVQDKKDLDHILKTGPTPPYIVVLERQNYTRKNLLEFKANLERVSGVVFLDRNHDDSKSRTTPFSPEDTCPNRYSGLYVNDSTYGDCKVNAWQRESPISGLLYDDIPYPIFLINDKESIEDIEQCFKNNNIIEADRTQASYPLCGMQLDSFMLAASDSSTCLNSHSFVDELLQSNGRRCETIENQSIFAYYKPAYGPLQSREGTNIMKPDIVKRQSIVLLTTKLSSLSMFTEISPGADSTITSIVTLLAIAQALAKVRNDDEVQKSSRNIAFALLDSEPFDYTGSSRIVHNMQDDIFPTSYFRSRETNITTNAIQNLNLSSIDYIINLDQLANYPTSENLYLHSDPNNKDKKRLDKVLDIMQQVASSEKLKFEHSDSKLPLPPTSVHQFIKYSQSGQPSESKLMGLVLSNYDKTYNDLFYHGIYDDSHNVYQTSKAKLVQHLAKVASFVAKSVYRLTFGHEPSNLDVDQEMIDTIGQLLECYLIEAECKLFTKAWQAGQKLPKGPIQTYKDVTKRSDDMNGAITHNLLAYFLGEKIPEYNLTQCYKENQESLIYYYGYINGRDEPINDTTSGVCIKSQVLMVSALSPAFNVSEDGITINQQYPAWTISLNSIRHPVRLFLRPSPIYQWCMFITGVVITVMSFLIVHRVKITMANLDKTTEMQAGTST